MAEHVSVSGTSFIEHYHQNFPPQTTCLISRTGLTLEAGSSSRFQDSRTQLIKGLIDGDIKHREFSQALMVEEIVAIALDPILKKQKFTSRLAPQTLESGLGQKGLDILISDCTGLTCLGIDVKLRKGRSNLDRDGFGWNPKLLSPYIYLSLGNWSVDTREQENIKIIEWLQNYTLHQIPKNGKIPKINQLRTFLFNRIEKSLAGYINSLKDPNPNWSSSYTPSNIAELEILEDKLFTIYNLFFQLNHGQIQGI